MRWRSNLQEGRQHIADPREGDATFWELKLVSGRTGVRQEVTIGHVNWTESWGAGAAVGVAFMSVIAWRFRATRRSR